MNDEMKQLMELSKENMLTSANLNRQMGVLNKAVSDLEIKQNETDKKVEKLSDDIQRIDDESRITRSQGKDVKRAVAMRTAKLLSLTYDRTGKLTPESINIDKRYRSGFIKRCYFDCKSQSRMPGSLWDTAKRDFEAVMEYIRNWEPPGGTEEYKRYLDLRHEEKAS